MLLRRMRRKDLRALQVFRQGCAEVGILERTQIFRLGRIGGANLSFFHDEVGFAQAAARKEFFICCFERRSN